ncbi:sensor histidine kinase [Archangium lipolyticum]|uniref:sensor histidine kinase n=1 Tax=Archangium lipolyticum TaxID=2970465 RepID=UPI002149EF58|nr:PAS domain-containing sensor histidine kinase [Archangium lipolyticum]
MIRSCSKDDALLPVFEGGGKDPIEVRHARSQDALADFVDSAAIGLHWVASDGTILWANKSDYEPLGYTAEEYIGHNITEFHADSEVIADILQRLTRGEKLLEYSARLRCKDGSVREVSITSSVRFDESGKFLHTRCFTRDVTEHLVVARALRESEERFRMLLAGVKDFAIFMLDAGGRVETWNLGAERLYGHSAEEIIGQHISGLYTEEDQRARREEEDLATASLHGRHESECERVRKDGSRYWAHVVTTAVRDSDGRLRGFAKVTRDVTDKRKAEEEKERLLRELKEAVAARDEFLSIASHELKTPLTSVKLNLRALEHRTEQTGEKTDGTAGRKIVRIHGQIDRLAKLVNSLLDVSRITANRLDFHLEEVDLGEVLQDVLGQFKEDLDRAGCSLHLRSDTGVLGRWDRLRLDQVVSNLLSNAIKYGPGRPVEVDLQRLGKSTRLVVRDHGIGISARDQERIFERFERAVSLQHYGGFGLGLWISRQIVEGLGGSIAVHSEPGLGSTFVVELPLGGPSDG